MFAEHEPHQIEQHGLAAVIPVMGRSNALAAAFSGRALEKIIAQPARSLFKRDSLLPCISRYVALLIKERNLKRRTQGPHQRKLAFSRIGLRE